jgi:hypothetical protein
MLPEWAVDVSKWLVSPALVIAAMWLGAQLYEPTLRWGRRLRRDQAFGAGIPEGDEKNAWNRMNVELARRLRLYRLAMTTKRRIGKYIALVYISFTVLVTVVFPPLNTPGEPPILGVADYYLMGFSLLQMAIVLTWISLGRSISGRNIEQMLVADRITRYRRREKHLRRLDKIRAERIAEGAKIKGRSSRLGFESQVDPLSRWVSTWEWRAIGEATGVHRGGTIDVEARISLAKKQRSTTKG